MYLEKLLKSDIFNSALEETVGQLVEAVVANTLLESRERLINEYKEIKNGVRKNSYVLNDLEEDAFQVSLRIQAFDMIIQEWDPHHKAFDFDTVPWWDDAEGLNE